MNNDISRAIQKRKAQKRMNLINLSMDSAVEWVLSIMLIKLHDRYGFGRRRFPKFIDTWHEVNDTDDIDLVKNWMAEAESNGLDIRKNMEFGERIQKCITGNKKDRPLIVHTRDLAAGAVIVNMHTLIKEFGWRKKRVHDLQVLINDDSYALKRRVITIWEIMKTLETECDVHCDLLSEYEKEFGPVRFGPF